MSESITGSTKAQSYPPIAKKVIGKTALEVQPKWPISNDGFGLLEGTVSFTTTVDNAGSIPVKRDSHPHDERLKCWKVQSTTRKGGLIDVEANYVGIESGMNTEPQVQITVGSTTDPIDTHNEFVTKIGGKPSAPLNGAIFVDAITGDATTNDAKGVFSEFSLIKTTGTKKERNIMAGIKSYYSPTITIKGVMYTRSQIFTQRLVGSMGKTTVSGNVRKLNLLPEWAKYTVEDLMNNSKAEGYYQPRNWLITGVNVEQYGAIYKMTYDLTLGGILGWNSYIYEKGE